LTFLLDNIDPATEDMMSLFGRSRVFRTSLDVMRLDIFMNYRPLQGIGAAAVQWVPIHSDDVNLRPFLIALLYARILTVHKETREQLFWNIDEISKQIVRDKGRTEFRFKEWALNLGKKIPPQTIWPWHLYENPHFVERPKIYKATLKAFLASAATGVTPKIRTTPSAKN
jgi:hypothetical protein